MILHRMSLSGLVVAVVFVICSLTSHAADRQPNVLVFLADDAGWGDYGIHGNKTSHTPNIDSIGYHGFRFESFYVCAVCAPTRAEFLTGRYHSRGGVRGVSTGQERLDVDEKTIADAFRAAGYATGAFGKWHNGSQWPYHPMARGFEQYYGHTSGHWGEYFDPPLEHNGQRVREKGYIVDLCTNHAIEFIEANRNQPFFCYVPFTTPHSPWGVPADKWEKYKDIKPSQPATIAENETVEETRCVYAMLENQDDNVGRVLKRLDELDLRDDTIIIYFSDNGPNTWRWNNGFKGKKGMIDDGGIRSPLLVSWKGKIDGGKSTPIHAGAIDLLPTLLSLTGVDRVGDKPLDGRDLSPLLLGRKSSWEDRNLFSHQNGAVSVRNATYRLDASGGLYDLTKDPNQITNVAASNPKVVDDLTNSVATWRKDVFGDRMAFATSGKGKGKGKQNKNVLADDRPFPVGYAEFPWSPLPARDGVGHGGIQRSSSAPNCSYFVNWKSLDDSITWDIAVNTSGTYRVLVEYTCPLADAGSEVELSFGESRVSAVIAEGWDPPLYTNQDTIPRPAGESKMKPFRELKMGEMKLEAGRGLLTLKAKKIPGSSVVDVLAVHLILEK